MTRPSARRVHRAVHGTVSASTPGRRRLDRTATLLTTVVLAIAVVQSEFLIAYVGEPFNAILCFGLPGILILILGLSLLVKFLRKYPKPIPENCHAG